MFQLTTRMPIRAVAVLLVGVAVVSVRLPAQAQQGEPGNYGGLQLVEKAELVFQRKREQLAREGLRQSWLYDVRALLLEDAGEANEILTQDEISDLVGGKDSPNSRFTIEHKIQVPSIDKSNYKRRQLTTFSVADKALPGDVAKLTWTNGKSGRLGLTFAIYAGEGRFPDDPANMRRSFFIWPYRTQLEYNTIPARRHQDFMTDWLSDKHLSVLMPTDSDFDSPDAAHGQMRWLSPKGASFFSLFQNTEYCNGTGEVTLYRLKGQSLHLLDLSIAKQSKRYQKGDEIRATINDPATVGVYSTLNHQSHELEGSGERTVSLGRIERPGIFWAAAFRPSVEKGTDGSIAIIEYSARYAGLNRSAFIVEPFAVHYETFTRADGAFSRAKGLTRNELTDLVRVAFDRFASGKTVQKVLEQNLVGIVATGATCGIAVFMPPAAGLCTTVARETGKDIAIEFVDQFLSELLQVAVEREHITEDQAKLIHTAFHAGNLTADVTRAKKDFLTSNKKAADAAKLAFQQMIALGGFTGEMMQLSREFSVGGERIEVIMSWTGQGLDNFDVYMNIRRVLK